MSLTELSKSIKAALASLPSPSTITAEARHELLQAITVLKASLETPLEATVELTTGDLKLTVARLAIDLGIFNTLANKSEADLATLAGPKNADKHLVFRLMRFLTAMGLVKAASAETWSPAPLAQAYVDGSPLRDAIYHFSSSSQAIVKLPSYFQQNGYQQSSDAYDGPWQYAFGSKSHFFEWLNDHPKDLSSFNRLMSLTRMDSKEDWFDFYPVHEKLAGCEATEPLLVDIGGGKLILQDLPGVIDHAKSSGNLTTGIQAEGCDFFTPQPFHSARAYYLRTILHDWPDKQAEIILTNIRAAMGAHSVLLLNENVMPDGPEVPLLTARFDLNMMTSFSSLERTQQQWLSLLDRSGFEVMKIWMPKVMGPGAGVLFEAKLKKV